MRVLMVDDHRMVLQGLRSLLEVLMNDLDIDMANTLGTALTLALGTRYDLVLLDWNLEDLRGDGFEARVAGELAAAVAAAQAETMSRRRALRAGRGA